MSTFVETDHPRARKGTFAEKLQSDPEVWLTSPTPKPESLKDIDFAEGIRSPNPRIARAAAAALFAQTRLAVTSYGERRGLSGADVQDAVSDALGSLNDYVRKGLSVKRGLVQVRAVTIVSQYMSGPIRHETARGLKLLAERTEKAETELGRPLGEKETDALAAAVRNTFEWRHRPAVGFHREDARPAVSITESELIDMEESGTLSFGAPNSGEHAVIRDRFEEQLYSKRKAGAGQYNLYAAGAGLPEATTQSLTEKQATWLISKHSDSIADIASRHARGEETMAEAAVLFAPFSNHSLSDLDRIGRAFADQTDFASRLWVSAVNSATKTEQKRKRAA